MITRLANLKWILCHFACFVLLTTHCVTGSEVSMATFNMEWLGYPSNSYTWAGDRASQLSQAADEILSLTVDIVALQEVIVDDLNGNALSDLLDELNSRDNSDSWNGIFSDHFSFWWNPDFENFPAMRQAFVWRDSKINFVSASTLLQYIPSGDPRFASGRLPLLLEVTAKTDNSEVSLYLINLHLKCCTDNDDRRLYSMTTLLDELNTHYADKPLVILGDFNTADRGGANGEISEWGFYDDDNGDLTADFFHAAGNVDKNSWDNIDHILLSDELANAYMHTDIADRNIIGTSSLSDHDPVITQLSFIDRIIDGTSSIYFDPLSGDTLIEWNLSENLVTGQLKCMISYDLQAASWANADNINGASFIVESNTARLTLKTSLPEVFVRLEYPFP